jgi:hypothetical protein
MGKLATKHWTFSADQLSTERYEEIKSLNYAEQIAALDLVADNPHSIAYAVFDPDPVICWSSRLLWQA